jgi:anti-anti-sigma regulatory factor
MSDIKAVNGSGITRVTRYGNPAIDCDGAQIRAQSRQVANVVTVSGAIGMANLERVTALVRRFVLTEKSFVIDLSGVTAITAQATSMLAAVSADCERAGADWAVIESDAVAGFLACTTQSVDVPVAESVADALQYFAEGTARRRNMLLPLLTRSA